MNEYQKNNQGSSMMMGLIIGVAIGAIAVAMKDKNNQDKVRKTMKKVRDWADKTSQDTSDKTDTAIKKAENDLENMRKEIKEPKE